MGKRPDQAKGICWKNWENWLKLQGPGESGKMKVERWWELDHAEARVSASSQSNEKPLVDVKQVGDMTSLGL